MNNTSILLTNQIMLIFAIVLLGGVVFAKVSDIIHLPDIVLYIFAGILLGPSMLNFINLSNFSTGSQLIFILGAAYILYDGGLEINLRVLNKVKVTVLLLSTSGVLISAVITGVITMKVFNIDLMSALLIGIVVASTDPSVLVPILRSVKLKEKLKTTIISESAFNDAVAAIITIALLGVVIKNEFSFADTFLELSKSVVIGAVIGIAIGVIASLLLTERSFGFLKEYPSKVALGAVCAAYSISAISGGSGFMSVFIAGLILGNRSEFGISHSKLHEETHFHFRGVLTVIFRMSIFIILGTGINLQVLAHNFWKAIIVVLALMFVARPIVVLTSVLPDRNAKWTFKEIIFLMWTRETGVIPAALAGMIAAMNTPNGQILYAVTLLTIIITISVQGSTSKLLAKKLKLDEID